MRGCVNFGRNRELWLLQCSSLFRWWTRGLIQINDWLRNYLKGNQTYLSWGWCYFYFSTCLSPIPTPQKFLPLKLFWDRFVFIVLLWRKERKESQTTTWTSWWPPVMEAFIFHYLKIVLFVVSLMIAVAQRNDRISFFWRFYNLGRKNEWPGHREKPNYTNGWELMGVTPPPSLLALICRRV